MEIRKATEKDLEEILRIYDSARSYMRENGNMSQWTDGYPGRDVVLQDIQDGASYVCVDEAELAAVFSMIFGEDPTYREIYDGGWLNDKPYAAVHRIAVHAHRKGVAAFCLDWCFRKCGNIRIDTHEDNRPMQGLLKKCGFTYCGVVYISDGSPRLAYQKSGE